MQPGYVFLTWEELEAMSEHLGLSVAETREQYGVNWDPEWACWTVDATDGKGCTFLDGRRGCSVHAVKPSQCRSFPFWPELLDEAAGWEKAKGYCPGLDAPQGRHYGRSEILAIRDGIEPGTENR